MYIRNNLLYIMYKEGVIVLYFVTVFVAYSLSM